MDSISGIEIYPLISFLIFFTFFVGTLIYIIRADKERMHKLGALPLDTETEKKSGS